MNKKEQYIVNKKNTYNRNTVRLIMIIINITDLICIEKMLFNIDLNVFTVIADFICSGILNTSTLMDGIVKRSTTTTLA